MALNPKTIDFYMSYTYPTHWAPNINGVNEAYAATFINIGIIFVIENLFDDKRRKKRSLSNNQLAIYNQLEYAFQGLHLNGKICFLRLICESQSANFSKESLLAKMFSTLFNPQGEERDSVLNDYVKAEELGKKSHRNCKQEYGKKCPLSIVEKIANLVGIHSINKIYKQMSHDFSNSIHNNTLLPNDYFEGIWFNQ